MKAGPYTDSFKENIIRLHLAQKRTIQSLSKEYGVSTSTISRWITAYRNRQARDNNRKTALYNNMEIRRTQK